MVRLPALGIDRLYPQEIFLVLIFVRRWVEQGYVSMKDSNDTNENRTCDLTACSAVPQLRHRVHPYLKPGEPETDH